MRIATDSMPAVSASLQGALLTAQLVRHTEVLLNGLRRGMACFGSRRGSPQHPQAQADCCEAAGMHQHCSPQTLPSRMLADRTTVKPFLSSFSTALI